MAAVPVSSAVHPDGTGEEKAKSQVEPKSVVPMEVTGEDAAVDEKVTGKETVEKGKALVEGDAKGEGGVEVEPKTGVSFPVKLDDGKQLATLGLRKKGMLGVGLKIYAFGMYADTAKIKEILGSKVDTALEKPTKELYDIIIDSDVGMLVRLVMVFGGLTMSMVRKNLNEGLGASLKKLTGSKNDELIDKAMGNANDSLKLSPGSVIEISRLPGYVFQCTVKGEVVSRVESELLCRGYFHMYLGDEPFDKEAKERLGKTLLSLF